MCAKLVQLENAPESIFLRRRGKEIEEIAVFLKQFFSIIETFVFEISIFLSLLQFSKALQPIYDIHGVVLTAVS